MKRVIQLVLLVLLVLIIYLFFNTYFKKNENVNLKDLTNKEEQLITETDTQSEKSSQNNLIKKLKYNVKFDDDSEYIINSALSELTYENGIEMVKMRDVMATILGKNMIPLVIRAENADYNTVNYNTFFRKNVEVVYLNHIIFSEKLDLNFDKNTILIHSNVVYEGPQGKIFTDNVIVDLLQKDINIYMNNKEKKVEAINKN